jgi:glycosyltransferase involved in cell wall biosynthesis
MKIVFVFPHFVSPGGAANVVLQFARALQQRQHSVVICCARISNEFREQNADLVFDELNIPTSNSFEYWLLLFYWQRKVNRRLDKYKDWILFPQVLPSNWWVWMYKRKNKQAKVVWYCHEPSAFIHSKSWINAIPFKAMKWGAKLLNPLLRRMDIELEKEGNIVICNSLFTKEQYKRVYKKDPEAVIYPPCAVKKVALEARKENFILTVARLSRFKKIDVLIRTFERLAKQMPDTRLVIVGDGEEKQVLERLVTTIGLNDRVCFKGSVSQERLEYFYVKARVTVICSRNEPFGLVPIESMMHGTPVIAHNSGGPRETITDGRTGFLYDDEKQLAELIIKIFTMECDRYSSLQRNCIEAAAAYDISNTIVELERTLEMANECFRPARTE